MAQKNNNHSWLKIGAQVLLGVVGFSTVLTGVSDRAGAERIASDAGYSDLEYQGKPSMFACPKRQVLYRDSFNARAADGRAVTVTVCQSPNIPLSLHTNKSLQVTSRQP